MSIVRVIPFKGHLIRTEDGYYRRWNKDSWEKLEGVNWKQYASSSNIEEQFQEFFTVNED